MKVVFFITSFLLGVVLTHANDTTGAEKSVVPQTQQRPASNDPSQVSEALLSKRNDSDVDVPPAHDSRSDTRAGGKSQSSHLSPEIANPKSDRESISHPSPLSPFPIAAADEDEPASLSPSPSPGSWNVTDARTHTTCIVIRGTISLNATLTYSNKTETLTVGLGPGTNVTGNCAAKYIRWIFESSRNTSLQFTFDKNDATKKFSLARVDGLVYFPKTNISAGFENVTLDAFKTPLNKSYSCHKSIELPLQKKNKTNEETEFTLILENFQIQAFKTSKSESFDESIDGCPIPRGGGTPDIIPIVVGCALAILVIVVLVAYLINRRRSQAHGYLSM